MCVCVCVFWWLCVCFGGCVCVLVVVCVFWWLCVCFGGCVYVLVVVYVCVCMCVYLSSCTLVFSHNVHNVVIALSRHSGEICVRAFRL